MAHATHFDVLSGMFTANLGWTVVSWIRVPLPCKRRGPVLFLIKGPFISVLYPQTTPTSTRIHQPSNRTQCLTPCTTNPMGMYRSYHFGDRLSDRLVPSFTAASAPSFHPTCCGR
jgi:hypothetical protein